MWFSYLSWYNCSRKSTKASKDEENFKLNTSKFSLSTIDSNFKLKDYLNLHKKSVQNYNELRKLQGSILRLCRQKLSDHFSLEFVASLNDDDIIRSLRSVQNRWMITKDNSLLKMGPLGNDEAFISRNEWKEDNCELCRKNTNHQDKFKILKKLFKKRNTKRFTRNVCAHNVLDDNHYNSKRFDVNTFHMRTQTSNLPPLYNEDSPQTWSCGYVSLSDECGCGEGDSKSLLHEQGYQKHFDRFNEKLKKHDRDIKQIKEGLRTCLDILIRIEGQHDDKQRMLMHNAVNEEKIYSNKPYVYCNKEKSNVHNKSQHNKNVHYCSRHGKCGWYV